MHLDYHILAAIALGIALSACCGFRIFIPMLVASVSAYNHWIVLSADMQWLGSMPAIICFATAAIVEVAAYYFPFLDNILDALAAPLAVLAGTLLAFALLPVAQSDPLTRWVAALIGGGATAGTIHIGTGLLRLFTTKATLGADNPLVASGENTVALTGSLLSLAVPVLVAAIMLVVVLWIVYKGLRRISTGRIKSL